MSRLEKIAVGELHPAGDNPRRVVDVDDEMVATMKSLGVLEPLLVNKSTINGFTVVAGHRRLAAAKKAGLKFVPCVIHEDLDDRTRAEMMLVENLQRHDLSPLEEATAYQRLVDLGRKQRDLAKVVGRSQSHLSKRMSLLKLPKAALDAIDSGGITLEQATGLAAVEPEKVEKLFAGRRPPSGYDIDRTVRAAERERKSAKVRKELIAAGVRVLDKEPGPAHSHRLSTYGLGLSPEEHAGEPCHVAVVGDWDVEAVYWCESPARHLPDGDSALKLAEDEDEPEEDLVPPDETPEQATHRAAVAAERARAEEEHKARAADWQRRADFCTMLARANHPASGYLSFVATMWIFSGEPDIDGAARLLGIELTEDWDWEERPRALAAWVNEPTGGPPWRASSAAYALALAFGLDQSRYMSEEDEEIVRPFFDHLIAQGYELSERERQMLGIEEPTEETPEESEEKPFVGDDHDHRISPVGKAKPPRKWRLVCACGFEALQTTEELARQRQAEHVAGAGAR